MTLWERRPALGSFDAVLAAAARFADAEALVSADGGFADVPRLVPMVPDADGVAALIGAPRM